METTIVSHCFSLFPWPTWIVQKRRNGLEILFLWNYFKSSNFYSYICKSQ